MATVFKLNVPIEVDGREIKEVTIRRPKARDLKRMDKSKGNIAGGAMLLSDLTGLTPTEVDELDGKDFAELSKMVADFFD